MTKLEILKANGRKLRVKIQWLPSLCKHRTGGAELSGRERKGECSAPAAERDKEAESHTPHGSSGDSVDQGNKIISEHLRENPGARGYKISTFCYSLWL